MSTSRSPPPTVTSPAPSEEDKRQLAKFMACADPGKDGSICMVSLDPGLSFLLKELL